MTAWVRYWAAEEGRHYFYNAASEETRWAGEFGADGDPREFEDGDAESAAAAAAASAAGRVAAAAGAAAAGEAAAGAAAGALRPDDDCAVLQCRATDWRSPQTISNAL